MRNVVGYAVSDWMTRPIARVVADYRKQRRLPPLASADDSFSKRAQVSQMPRAFDFPRVDLLNMFHYVGREFVFRCFAEATDELNMRGRRNCCAMRSWHSRTRRLNTVLDSITFGVPTVAIAITYEQPAIARRVDRAGVGAWIALPQLTAYRLRTVAFDVVHTRAYSENASLLQSGISECAGVLTASNIIEKLMVLWTDSSRRDVRNL
jgi:zeaxanthin glucosyltransferase